MIGDSLASLGPRVPLRPQLPEAPASLLRVVRRARLEPRGSAFPGGSLGTSRSLGSESHKLELMAEHPHDRAAYTAGKTEFISRITQQAKQHYRA